jgi:2-keto-4-pentenoate hydratase/2-oxohepta-3-ene-1,7-dioic acid hydratase in catechol pathway
MRLVNVLSADGPRAALVVDDLVIDAAQAGAAGGWRSVLSTTGAERERLLDAARRLAEGGSGQWLEEVELGPPIPDPEKIICVGLNYAAHAQEIELDVPESPVLFAKFRNALRGPAQPIVLPTTSEQIDYEGELALVIGRSCKDVPVAEARDCIAGYMVFNDVSARDLQFRTGQWLPGKALDTFAPCGPWLVTPDEIGDPQDLRLTTRVNGAVVQDASTAAMIFPIDEIVAHVSTVLTLVPGDIIATGTPVGVGVKRDPPLFLHDGDLVEVQIDGIGAIANPVVGPQTPDIDGGEHDHHAAAAPQ